MTVADFRYRLLALLVAACWLTGCGARGGNIMVSVNGPTKAVIGKEVRLSLGVGVWSDTGMTSEKSVSVALDVPSGFKAIPSQFDLELDEAGHATKEISITAEPSVTLGDHRFGVNTRSDGGIRGSYDFVISIE